MIKTEKKRRYKAQIVSIAPKSLAENIVSLESTMLGISLGTKNSEDMRLAASLEFMCLNFNRRAIIVADAIYRLTLQVRDNMAPDISRYSAIREGKKWFSRNRRLIEKYQSVYDIEIIYFSELSNKSEFTLLKKQIETLALTSGEFMDELETFARSYMDRAFPDKSQRHTEIFEAKYRLAKQYLIEECAYNAYLKGTGWNSVVYAGTIATFERLAGQNIENAPKQLFNLPFISLKFDKRGKVNTSYVPEVLAPDK